MKTSALAPKKLISGYQKIILLVALCGCMTVMHAQSLDSMCIGQWCQAHFNSKDYTLHMDIAFGKDGSASYYRMYPERSYALRYSVGVDSILALTNGYRYKIDTIGKNKMILTPLHHWSKEKKVVLVK